MTLKKCKIKDLGHIYTGNTPPTSDRKYYGDKYPLIKPTDMMIDGRYIGKTGESLSEEGYNLFKGKLVPENTPCVVTIGTIGKLCLTKEPSFCNQAVNSIVVNRELYDPLYVFYLMKISNHKVKFLSSGTASGRENVSKTAFENIEIDVHNLPNQRKITAILSAYDDLIENNTRRIKILEEMAQALYREWFVKFRFLGHEKVKMVESELGIVPEGWEVKGLGDLADINASSIKKGNKLKEISYIDIASVSIGQIDNIKPINFVDAPSRARRMVKHGDIIWSTVRPNRKSYSIILRPAPNLIVSTGFVVITAKLVPYTYLYHALTTDGFVGYLTNHASGSAYPAVNSGDFNNASVLLPPNTLLQSFHNI
ncbi:MAG: restriction endonuclease subunit S, partial [Candidatus Heimdallarchaeota archaeon]|nr:restriction endonuclease subunit S [Candidatus Heimdallarchaeota archaeon]